MYMGCLEGVLGVYGVYVGCIWGVLEGVLGVYMVYMGCLYMVHRVYMRC